jgi:uncharacterized protein involved in exopolysaccharide biosynthesis
MAELYSPLRTDTERAEVNWRQELPVISLFFSRKRTLAKAGAIGLALATLIAFLIPKQYESTVQVMPPDPQTSSSTLALLMGSPAAAAGFNGLASSLLMPRSPGSVFVGILQSRSVSDDIINRFDLRSVYHQKRYLETRKHLARWSDVSEDKKTGIITLTVTDTDPVRARNIAATYVQELDKLVAQLSTSSARRERTFLEERVKAVKQDLDVSTKELADFSTRNGAIDIQAQGKAMLEAGARAQGELIASESELRGLQEIYAPTSVKIQAAQARVAELKHQLQKMSGSSQVDQNSSADDIYPPLRQLPQLGLRYYDLVRRAKTQEAVFEALTKQYEIARVQEAREIPTVKVLDQADVPEKKSFPPRIVIMVLGMLLAICAACAWIVIQRWWTISEGLDPKRALAAEIWESTSRSGFRIWRRR